MAGAEGVVLAFGALGEAGEPVALAQRADAGAPPGSAILGADRPDGRCPQRCGRRRAEHVVQRDRQLDDPEAGAEMPAGHRNRADRLRAQLFGELVRGRSRSACANRQAS